MTWVEFIVSILSLAWCRINHRVMRMKKANWTLTLDEGSQATRQANFEEVRRNNFASCFLFDCRSVHKLHNSSRFSVCNQSQLKNSHFLSVSLATHTSKELKMQFKSSRSPTKENFEFKAKFIAFDEHFSRFYARCIINWNAVEHEVLRIYCRSFDVVDWNSKFFLLNRLKIPQNSISQNFFFFFSLLSDFERHLDVLSNRTKSHISSILRWNNCQWWS